jgi:LVIVD repeat
MTFPAARIALCAAALLAIAPAAALAHPGHHHPGAPGATPFVSIPFPPMGPSAGGYSSPNVEFVKNFPQHFDSAGGRKLGDYFYITTERDLTIYDVSDPPNPVEVGHLVLPEFGEPVFTEEDPDTNGEILLIGNNDVLMVIDVSDKANPTVLSTLAGADDHTVSCVLDCSWAYGSEGTIVDLRDPANPVLSESNWQTADIKTEHDVTEVSPGIVLTSTQPLKLLDARHNPENPKVLASTPEETGRFTHANLWPRGGEDDFMLVGGEAIGPDCSAHISASFSTWDARSFRGSGETRQIDEFRLAPGEVTEGRAPESSFCVHWFDEHPAYANGGLVAIGWYEHGTHFLRINRDGTIDEVGWFLGGGGQASAAYWIDERTVYVADYIRGLDVLRYTGEIPAPGDTSAQPQPQPPSEPPAPPADQRSGDAPSAPPAAPAAACVDGSGFRSASVRSRGRGLTLAFRRTSQAPVDVDVFRQSAGRRVFGAQLVARFRGRTADVAWDGTANRRGRRVSDGYYLVRYRTRTAGGVDTRRVALRRRNGRWSTRPAFERPDGCGLIRRFKLERPVFGGRSARSLGISYRLARAARVRVTVTRGATVVRRFRARNAAAGRTHRLRLGARRLARGDYRVRIDARGAGERVATSAVSRRL